MRLTLSAVCLAALVIGSLVRAASQEPVPEGAIRIGLIVDMSGPYAYLTGEDEVAAARMAIEDFGGQVLGRPVELIYADHASKSDVAVARARDWFSTGRVDAVLDVTGSPSSLAVARIARQFNRIVVFNSAAASRLTNEACTPVTVHWTFDSYALAHVTAGGLVKAGGSPWYFVTADTTAGLALEKDAADVVREEGGAVLGSSMHAVNIADFSSHVQRAQRSEAKVIGLATYGPDLIKAIQAARRLGVTAEGKQRLAALLIYIDDIHDLGLPVAQGLFLGAAFYWDLNDESRAWSKRFLDRRHKMPNMIQAGVYSATLHYLKAVQAAGTNKTESVMAKMRELTVDFFGTTGRVREDGRMVHDMYLFEVKKPEESSGPWDYYKLRATVPAEQAFLPLVRSACPLIAK
jgi:branched-chain amino acid transport system substrate-binding protein